MNPRGNYLSNSESNSELDDVIASLLDAREGSSQSCPEKEFGTNYFVGMGVGEEDEAQPCYSPVSESESSSKDGRYRPGIHPPLSVTPTHTHTHTLHSSIQHIVC